MKRKVKVILTAAIFTFCTAIGGCKAVESKLEPVYEALLQEDSVQEEKSVQACENQERSTKEDLYEKESEIPELFVFTAHRYMTKQSIQSMFFITLMKQPLQDIQTKAL